MRRVLDLLVRRIIRKQVMGAAEPSTHIAEITPCIPRLDDATGERLNLVLPSINGRHYFGGIHTAVLFYRELCRHYPSSRIILLDSDPDNEALQRFPDHVLVAPEETSDCLRQIVPFSNRYGRTLPVSLRDQWLATAWWTAYASQQMASWQRDNGGVDAPIAYLIQDYEPGFYAWSSQHALALSTYRPDRDIGIFNTSLLANYFESQSLRFQSRFVFEPTINDGLRGALTDARDGSDLPRNRRIVVYGRPGTPRNAFELICEGLRHWGWTDQKSERWEVCAPGELVSDLDLGPLKIRALGKLDINAYARLLSESSIGLSLMVSPHPSYPPLEMSAFGMQVLTNRYGNKDLASCNPNIDSIGPTNPQGIASAMARACGLAEKRGLRPLSLVADDDPFLEVGTFGRLADDVTSTWRRVLSGVVE